MNQLPPVLSHALQQQRLLMVWGDAPFELPLRVVGERAVVINLLLAKAEQWPSPSIRLSATPPLPIVSVDPTDRIEREFKANGRALRVVKSARDVSTPRQHTLIKLAGDLNSRMGLVLSREEVQRIPGDADKRYLLDLVRPIVEGGAVIIVKDVGGFDKLPASGDDFQVWWPILRPAFGSVPIFATGDPSTAWPGDVTYLGTVQDVMSAIANLAAPIPKIEGDFSFAMQPWRADNGAPMPITAWLDCEVRIHDRSEAGYKIEMTLDGEQTIQGTMSAGIAAFVPTDDPRDDGQGLFEALFADKDLREAWGEARGQSKQRRIRLRIDPLELRSLPWELLRDDDNLLAAQAATPFSRYLATDQPWGGAIAARPMRVLAVISNPIDLPTKYDLPPADVELEEKTLYEAFAPLSHPVSAQQPDGWPEGKGSGSEGVSLTFLSPPVTLTRLEEALLQGYHVLHFIGHGRFNAKSQQASLYLQQGDGTAAPTPDADFIGMLNRLSSPPQLIVLAACQSAQQAQTDAFSGLGPQLVQIGIPAVVAMQDNVTVLTARQFGAKFYRRLLEHGTVDRAMNEARSALITNGRFDAAVPVLFMRLRDGRLWVPAWQVPALQAPAPRSPIEPPQPIGHVSLSEEERTSLERQLQSARENLRLIEERKLEYVLETDVPLQLIKDERRLKDRVAELERQLGHR